MATIIVGVEVISVSNVSMTTPLRPPFYFIVVAKDVLMHKLDD